MQSQQCKPVWGGHSTDIWAGGRPAPSGQEARTTNSLATKAGSSIRPARPPPAQQVEEPGQLQAGIPAGEALEPAVPPPPRAEVYPRDHMCKGPLRRGRDEDPGSQGWGGAGRALAGNLTVIDSCYKQRLGRKKRRGAERTAGPLQGLVHVLGVSQLPWQGTRSRGKWKDPQGSLLPLRRARARRPLRLLRPKLTQSHSEHLNK